MENVDGYLFKPCSILLEFYVLMHNIDVFPLHFLIHLGAYRRQHYCYR